MNEKILTSDLVRAWVDDYRKIHDGSFPHTNAGKIPGTSENWNALNRAMANCHRGWVERMSLHAWLNREYPESQKSENLRDLKLTPEILKEWVNNYRIVHGGKFPTASSGRIEGESVSWQWVNVMMRKEQWDWTEMRSLASWLNYAYPSERILNAEILRKWVDSYRSVHHGKFPTSTSGVIQGTKTTWSAVNSRMTTGFHHLPANISLTAWIDDAYSDERAGANKFSESLPCINVLAKKIFLNIVYHNSGEETPPELSLTLASAKLNNLTFHYINITVEQAVQQVTKNIVEMLKTKELNQRPAILTMVVSRCVDGIKIDWKRAEKVGAIK